MIVVTIGTEESDGCHIHHYRGGGRSGKAGGVGERT
jgi:hypothetical protein